MVETLGIGMIGYGMIGRMHALGLRELNLMYPGQLPRLRLAAVCTAREATACAAAEEAGFATGCCDLESLVRRPDVDVVLCLAPNDLHRPAVLAAIAAGKPVLCEKPLALNLAEAREIAAAAEGAGVPVGLVFNYRFLPATLRARQLVEEGALGQIYHFRAEYLHSGYQDPNRPMGWRLRRERAGGGALVDLGSHAIDLVRHLLGEFTHVRAETRTFVTERPVMAGSTQKEPVTVDDAAWLQVRLSSGATGTLEASRFATGAVDDLRLEIHGEKGALRFNLMDANWLYWYDATRPHGGLGGERGWTRLETVSYYPGAALPPGRTVVGWGRTLAENDHAFLRAVMRGERPQPDVTDGLRVQAVLEAAYQAAESGGWVQVAAPS
ncbi:MAG: Gfo/Idh/MocA family protein [Anaerolineae bacterium]